MSFRNSYRRMPLACLALVVAVLLAGLFAVPTPAFAADYYNSWKEYKVDHEGESITWNHVVDEMDKLLEHGKEAYAAGDYREAYEAANNAYYGWYETTGFERTVMGYISGARVSEVELAFASPRSIAKSDNAADRYDEYCSEMDRLSTLLHEDANILDGTSGDSEGSGNAGAIATFFACFSILVREGLEAILVVGAIIAYLVKSGNQKSLKSVYIGAILGIVCSFICAWLLNLLKLSNTAPQEIIEGVTALIAVCVLYYVSNWMLSKSETEAWNSYIQDQVDSSVETGSGFALAFTAWLSVFREGAEVILFYQPLLSGGNMNMVWLGVAAGFAVLVAVYIAVRYFSVRLPLKPFFRFTSIFMFCMSISFLGSGIKELIEGNVFTSTPMLTNLIPYNDVLDVLGIYPIAQTLIPQLLLLAVTVFIYLYQVRKARRQLEEAKANA